MPTLYIIDGYGQFFRAFHAIRTPTSSPVTKEPTNMTFGFVGMMLKLLRGEGAVMQAVGGKPDHSVMGNPKHRTRSVAETSSECGLVGYLQITT